MLRTSSILAGAVLLSALSLIIAFTNTPAAAKTDKPEPVTVQNTPLPVRDVDHPARTPFQQLLTVGYSGAQTSFTVPANGHLVIEFVTVQCGLGGSQPPLTTVGLRTTASGVSVGHGFVPVPVTEYGGSTFFATAQTARLYADPGSTVSAYYSAPVGLLSVNCAITLSGFLAPVL